MIQRTMLKPICQLILACAFSMASLSSVYAETTTPTPVAKKATPTKLAINKNGVKVWTFQSENNPAFNYRATTVVNSTLSGATAIILDTQSMSKWVPYTKKMNVLDLDEDKGTFTIHMILNFPFPLSWRDVVFKGVMSQDAKGMVTIKTKSVVDPRVPVNPKMVRISQYEGMWTLRALSKTQVEVTTEGFADPAGNLPLSIVNMFVEQQPYDMLKNMQKAVLSYQSAVVPHVVEPKF